MEEVSFIERIRLLSNLITSSPFFIVILLLLNPNVMNFVRENIYNQIDMEENKFWITTSLISIPFILIIGTCIGFIKLNISSLKSK